jgi:hypothetical protein
MDLLAICDQEQGHIGSMASRGIEAFNKAVEADMLVFVQWSTVKTYLKGLFSEWS